MASNLATIRVELIANAQKFKSNIAKATKSLGKVDKATKKTASGQKKIQNAFRNTAGSIAAVQGPLGPVAGRITAIGAVIGRVSPVMLAFTAIGVGLGLALTKLIKNTMGVETQMLKLEAILKATGNAAGLSLMQIEDLAREIGISTLASVAKVRDAAGILLTFKSIQGDVFKDALRLSQDLAEVGFGDLKMGATQLGKALEDPVVGLGALRRVGVSFTEDQKEMIKVLSMTNRKVEAQEIIIKALNEQVGGAGVKAATGLAGAIDSLKENLDIFFETTKAGTWVVHGLTKAFNFLADAIGNADVNAKSLKSIKQISEQLKIYKKELKETSGLTIKWGIIPTLKTGRKKELQSLINDLKNQMGNLADKSNRDFIRKEAEEAVKALDKQKEALSDLGKIRKTNLNTHERATNRAIIAFGKTEAELKNLNDLYKLQDELRKKLGSDGKMAEEAIRAQMKLSIEIIKERNAKLKEASDIQRDLDAIAQGLGKTFASVGDKISDAMFRGKLHTLDFKNILNEMIIALQKMIFKVMVLDEIQRKLEERMRKGTSEGGWLSILKGVLGMGNSTSNTNSPAHPSNKAGGGTVQQGQPTLVGERGPELFVPQSAGVIRNNADSKSSIGGSGGVSITQNLNFAVGITNTVRAEVMNMLPAIQQSTLSAVADAKQRGGKFSKAFGE